MHGNQTNEEKRHKQQNADIVTDIGEERERDTQTKKKKDSRIQTKI